MHHNQLYPLPAVRALIHNKNNQILLLKRSYYDDYADKWCLPGGKIDFGQTAKEALKREIKEELDLLVRYINFLFFLDGLPETMGEKHYITLFFECKVEGEIKLNWESSRFAWVGAEDLAQYDIAFRNDEAMKRFWKDQFINL